MPKASRLSRSSVLAVCATALLCSGAARAQMPFAALGGRSVALGGASMGLGPDVAAAIDKRAGASVNLESPDRSPAFTGGAGAVIGPAKVDLGGWYRTDQSALGVSITARVGL